jgi:hypothetical protein
MSEAKEPTKVDEAQQVWQSYLQKCCEHGQLLNALDQLDSQKREIEKKVELTAREVRSLSHKHRANQSQGLVLKPEPPQSSGAPEQASH